MPAKKQWDLGAERELWASFCAPNGMVDDNGVRYTHEDSLYWFLKIAWGAEWYLRDSGELWWISEDVHIPYLRWLQSQLLAWKRSRKLGITERWLVAIIIPRGFGKTVTATKAATLWSHLDEPNMTTMIGSEIQPKAVRFLQPIKEVLEGKSPYSWFSWLYGRWHNTDRLWTKDALVHGYRKALALTEPSIGTFGVDSGLTGDHPLQVWWDDPLSQTKITKGKTEGGAWLEKAVEAWDAASYAVRTDGWYSMVLTRYMDNDVAGTYLTKEGVLSWDGMPPIDDRIKISPKGKWRVYFLQARDLARDGAPVLPRVWSEEELQRRESTNPQFYAAQLMNDPGTGEHMPLDKKQIEDIYVERNDLYPIEYATIHLDTAFKRKERQNRGDYNVIGVVKHDLRNNGLVYFDHAKINNTWRVEQFLIELVATVRLLRSQGIRIRAITDERDSGGRDGSWRMLVTQAIEGAGLRMPEFLEISRQSKDKEARIRQAAGYWVEGNMRLMVPRKDGVWRTDMVPGLEMLIQQMLRIGVTKYDDVSDAVSDCWNEAIWRKPQFLAGITREEGVSPVQPGDEYLKSFSKRVSNDELRQLYDQQFGGPQGEEEGFDPHHENIYGGTEYSTDYNPKRWGL